MSSWYLLSLKIESELLYPRFCVSRGKMWMAPFIASQPPLYLFLLLQHATKKDRLWSCSASQLPQESKLSCLRKKKKKKKEEEEEEKKANTLIIQSWGGAWSVNANQLLSEEIREKRYSRQHKKEVSFSQQLVQSFCESTEHCTTHSRTHTADNWQVQKEETTKKREEKVRAEIERD